MVLTVTEGLRSGKKVGKPATHGFCLPEKRLEEDSNRRPQVWMCAFEHQRLEVLMFSRREKSRQRVLPFVVTCLAKLNERYTRSCQKSLAIDQDDVKH